MLAIGIGINNPMRTIELWGYLISMLCGMCLYGFFLASLTTAITEADASAKQTEEFAVVLISVGCPARG